MALPHWDYKWGFQKKNLKNHFHSLMLKLMVVTQAYAAFLQLKRIQDSSHRSLWVFPPPHQWCYWGTPKAKSWLALTTQSAAVSWLYNRTSEVDNVHSPLKLLAVLVCLRSLFSTSDSCSTNVWHSQRVNPAKWSVTRTLCVTVVPLAHPQENLHR